MQWAENKGCGAKYGLSAEYTTDLPQLMTGLHLDKSQIENTSQNHI